MISVCMATYNGETFLREQLDSILSQLGPEDEVIVSDDGSTDRTLAIIAEYNDSRIRVVHSIARNVVYNFENALKQARGEYIFLSDQDDIWRPDKVAQSLAVLKNGAALVVSDSSLIDKDGQEIAPSYFALRKPQPGLLGTLYKNTFIGCCMAFRREVLDKALPFPNNLPMHDSWLGTTAALVGPVEWLYQPLVQYRRHEGALSSNGRPSTRGLGQQLKDRWVLARAYVLRRLRIA